MEELMKAPPETKARRLQTEMDQAGVGLAFGMGHLNADKNDPLGIGSTLRLAALVPRVRAIGAADPRRTDRNHLSAVERQIERERDKLVALKVYLGYLHFGPEDPHYVPYYKLAAKYSLPVVFHTGDTWSTKAKLKFAHPLRVDEVAVDHPDVRFVIAHFGNPWLIDAAEVIFKNDNVWADLSGLYVGDEKSIDDLLKQEPLPDLGAGVMISDLKKAFRYAERPDRFLYGSDWPLVPMAVYRRLIEAIIPKEHHEAVFRTNAERLLGLNERRASPK
jgi:predicted TIM-barrel fold metal-dependent hydrolase